jgi:hypothetical protein
MYSRYDERTGRGLYADWSRDSWKKQKKSGTEGLGLELGEAKEKPLKLNLMQ